MVLHQKRRLARTGARNQVQRQDAALAEIGAVFLGQRVVLGQKIALDRQHPAFRIVIVVMMVIMLMVVVMS